MKKYLSLALCMAVGLLAFTSCGDDDNNKKDQPVPMRTVAGVYVLNEGSYPHKVNGSLDYYAFGADNQLTPTRNIFQTVNGRSLGGTPNNAVINRKGEMYIATTDENRVEIVDAKTMKSVAVAKIRQPRELAYDDNAVYVSSYTGRVYKIDEKSHEVVDSSEVVGQRLEGIAVVGGNVYVCNAYNADYTYNKNVVKLNAGLDKVKDIAVLDNPTQLVVSGSDLFLVSTGNYNDVSATVQQINTTTDAVTTIGNATMIAVGGDRLYMVNAPYGSTPTYSYYDLKAKTVSKWIVGSELFNPYAIAVDPWTEKVYVSSQNENPDKPGTPSYTTDGYFAVYKKDGTFLGKHACGVSPGTIVFWSYDEEIK